MSNSVCEPRQSCHVNGRGITMFGATFPQSLVRDLASCSVQLVAKGHRFASGTLIDPEVVLMASHSLTLQQEEESGRVLNTRLDAADIEVNAFYECEPKTAPPAPAPVAHRTSPLSPPKPGAGPGARTPSCTQVATEPQATCYKILEEGLADDLDYALLALQWKKEYVTILYGTKVVTLPREPVVPKPTDHFDIGSELIVVGHPDDAAHQGEPTQASTGNVVKKNGPNYITLAGDEYGYALFPQLRGYSGGGVFNSAGELVGVLAGKPGTLEANKLGTGNAVAFLRVAMAAKRSSRLSQWLSGKRPLNPGDVTGLQYCLCKQ